MPIVPANIARGSPAGAGEASLLRCTPWPEHQIEFRRFRDCVHEAIELIAGFQTPILRPSFEDTGIEPWKLPSKSAPALIACASSMSTKH